MNHTSRNRHATKLAYAYAYAAVVIGLVIAARATIIAVVVIAGFLLIRDWPFRNDAL